MHKAYRPHFRERLRLIKNEHEEIFPLMVKKRNEIVHIYSDEDAYETYLLVKSTFVDAIQCLLTSLMSRGQA